jgi:hypothetical protein
MKHHPRHRAESAKFVLLKAAIQNTLWWTGRVLPHAVKIIKFLRPFWDLASPDY